MQGKRLFSFFIAVFLLAAGTFLAVSIAGYLIYGQKGGPGGAAGDFLADRGLFLFGWAFIWLPFAFFLSGLGAIAGIGPKQWARLAAGMFFGLAGLLILLSIPFIAEGEVARTVTQPSSGAAGYLLGRWLHEKTGWAGLLAGGGFFATGSALLLCGTVVFSAINKTARTAASFGRTTTLACLAAAKSTGGYLKQLPAKMLGGTKKKQSEEKLKPREVHEHPETEKVPETAKLQKKTEEKKDKKKSKEPEIITTNKTHTSQKIAQNNINQSSESGFQLPPFSLLHKYKGTAGDGEDESTIRKRGEILERTLQEFNVEAEVVRVQRGPVVTMYEMALAPGTKVSKVESLDDDLAIALKAPNVRIVAPIPGKSTIGIEVPNANRETVTLRELFSETGKDTSQMEIPLYLGKDTAGAPLMVDLAMAPHLLIAGATGSGKSISINSIICSIIMTRTPEEVQMLLVDPKSVEFTDYQTIPHLISPVVTDMKKAAGVLQWACKKMDDRFSMLSRVGVRNISQYNRLGKKKIISRLDPEEDADLDDVPFHMPHIVIIIDELGELMLVAAKEVESSIIRLSQKARAVGIHLICATQRPSADVITGLIKANLPVKIAFQVSSKINSRVILDRNGAELLLGRGDMLMIPPGSSRLIRAQGTFVPQSEATDIVQFVAAQETPSFMEELKNFNAAEDDERAQEDELYDEAVRIVLETQRGSVSLLQRRLAIGYSRAARLIDMIADAGLIGPYKGSQAREVHMTLEEWENARTKNHNN